MPDPVEPRSSGTRAQVARKAIASAMSLGIAAVLFHAFRRDTHGWIWIVAIAMVTAPVLAAAAIWTRPLALQLLARAFWWVQLLFACFISLSGVRDGRVAALAVAGACALLSAGRLGLEENGAGRFRPVAFRGTLMLALVLAIADAGTFSWIGILQVISEGKVRFILLAPPMIAAVIGLLRLRTWGLLVSVVTNVMVAVLLGTRALEVDGQIRALFIGMATVQLLIPLPMWVTIIRRRPPPPDRWQRTRVIGSTGVILLLAAVSVAAIVGGVPHPVR